MRPIEAMSRPYRDPSRFIEAHRVPTRPLSTAIEALSRPIAPLRPYRSSYRGPSRPLSKPIGAHRGSPYRDPYRDPSRPYRRGPIGIHRGFIEAHRGSTRLVSTAIEPLSSLLSKPIEAPVEDHRGPSRPYRDPYRGPSRPYRDPSSLY
jgi:hypothetical protein